MGLGAALLSDEKHVADKSGYRPVNLRKIMATLVVQRALMRNMKRKNKLQLYDVVLAAEAKAGTRRMSRQRVPVVAKDGHPRAAAPAGAGGIGSLVLPPDSEESAWLMRRFLLGLQEDVDELGGRVAVRNRREKSAASAAHSSGLQLSTSRGGGGVLSEKGTENGSPAADELMDVAVAKRGDDRQGDGSRLDRKDSSTDTAANSGGRRLLDGNNNGLRGKEGGGRSGNGSQCEDGQESSVFGWFRSLLSQNRTGDGRDTVLENGHLATRGDTGSDHGSPSRRFDEEGEAMSEGGGADDPNDMPVTSLAMWLRGNAES